MRETAADATLMGFADCQGFAAEIVATAGALIIVLDRRGRIVAFNPACERLIGYRCAEARTQASTSSPDNCEGGGRYMVTAPPAPAWYEAEFASVAYIHRRAVALLQGEVRP